MGLIRVVSLCNTSVTSVTAYITATYFCIACLSVQSLTFVPTLIMLKQGLIFALLLSVLFSVPSLGQKKLRQKQQLEQSQNDKKMKVDVWSDVMCPFCYIGKRHLEAALQEFEHADKIEVVWHSYQLDPDAETVTDKDAYTYLAERKGQTVEWSKQAHQQVTDMAAKAGLRYDFDKVVIANSFDAHRLSHYAKEHGKGNDIEEQLFKAHFTDGKNIADHQVLAELAANVGLDKQEVLSVLATDKYADAVQKDIETAAQLRVGGVPFFVLNKKYGVSGAQPAETFLQALQQSWEEYEKDNPALTMVGDKDAAACDTEGNCE